MKSFFCLFSALWISSDLLAQTPFITTWKTDNPGTSTGTSIAIPTTGTGYSYDVDWTNDGIYDELGITGNATHDYGAAGTYTVAIRGSFPRIYFNNGGDRRKILSVNQWGSIAWTSMSRAFDGCSNLTVPATDVPNLAGVTDMSRMFYGCIAFNQALPAGFNTASVTNMREMFAGCSTYNQPLPSSFNTAAVTDMASMFSGCSAYNQALPINFNTAAVTNMGAMFFNCSAYNQALPSSFNTTLVTDMIGMFYGCSAYNQPLPSSFNTAAVTNMVYMFSGCRAYNQALPSSFNTAAVTDMNSMFYGCSAYNQPLPNSFNTASVTNMFQMFSGCSAYNQALPNSFNTTAVTNMVYMFSGCRAYNQALPSGFNTAAVTNMSNLFDGAAAFNQNLGRLNIGAANIYYMLNNSGLSRVNYDSTLIGWNNAGYLNKNLGSASPLQYCAAQSARSNMITNKGWSISGDTYTGACLPLNYTIMTTGGNVVITDITGTGETLTISESSGKIRFVVPGKTYSIDSGPTTAFTTPAEILISTQTSITVNAGAGNDTINVGAFTTQLPTFTLNGGTGDDLVNMNGNISFRTNAHLDINLKNDDPIPGADAVTFAANAVIRLSGTGIGTVKTGKHVTFNSGSILVTSNGNMTVEVSP